jgi:hypothetical protein
MITVDFTSQLARSPDSGGSGTDGGPEAGAASVLGVVDLDLTF